MLNICYCGSAAGYPHAPDCPRPLFRGSDSAVQAWQEERAEKRLQRLAHACQCCGLEVDNWDYTLCGSCFEAGQRAGGGAA